MGTVINAYEGAGPHKYDISAARFRLQPGTYLVRITISDRYFNKPIILTQ
jgi:hypothetical protein